MPYEIHKDGEQYVVRKKGAGKVFGRHKTKAEAEAQMRALYAGEKRAGARKSDDGDEPAEICVYAGGAVKALEEEGRIGGYLALWGSPDETDATKDRDYFTPETDFGRFLGGEIDVLYHHSFPAVKGRPNPLYDIPLGVGTVRKDDVGLWLDGRMDLAVPAVRTVWDTIKADDDAYGLSSGAITHLYRRVPQPNGTGWLKRWPIVEASVTPSPGEPRTAVVALKSLIEDSDSELFVDSCLRAATDLTASVARFAKIGPAKRDAIRELRDALDSAVKASTHRDAAEIARKKAEVERLLARF